MRHKPLYFIVWIIIPITQLAAQNDQLSSEQLIKEWQNWAAEVRGFVPRYAQYELEEPSFRERGFEKADVKSYLSSNTLFAREQVLTPSNANGNKQWTVAIHSPKYYALVAHDFVENGWFVKSLKSPQEWSVISDYVSYLGEVPGSTENIREPIDIIYILREVERTLESVELEIEVVNPAKELSAAWGEVLINRMEVRFERSRNWKPVRISRHFDYAEDFWYHAKLEDWREIDGLELPHAVTESSTLNGAPFLSFKLKELRRVDIQQVLEHCSLPFYGIPDDDLRPKQTPLVVLVLLALVCAFLSMAMLRKFWGQAR